MKVWSKRLILLASLTLFAALVAFSSCTGETEQEPTPAPMPTPVPTQAPAPTAVPATPTPQPTQPTPTPTFVARPAPTDTPRPAPTPTPRPAPTPTPEVVEESFATFTSDLFNFSFEYPENWRLSEERREISVSIPGQSAEVDVSIHILTTPQTVHEYTDVVLESLEEEYPSFLVRSTAGRQVGEVPGLVNRAQSTTDAGTVTYFKIYTAAIGRVGVTFALSGDEEDVQGAEAQFDALADSSRFPSGSLEIPEASIEKQAVGTGFSRGLQIITGENTVFEQDNEALYAAVEFELLPVDTAVEFLWVKVNYSGRVERVLTSTTSDIEGEVHWSAYTPEDGLELGFYLVAILQDESFVAFLPFTVIIEEGAEFMDTLSYEDWTGFLLFVVRDPERAVYAATKAIELDPENVQAYVWRAEAYQQQCKIRPAIADHSQAVKLLPDNPVTVATRGSAYWHAFDYDLALDDFTRALELVAALPRDTERQINRANRLEAIYYNNRALIYTNKGQIGEALDDVARALELAPDSTHYLDTRAYAYLKGGRIAEAKEDYVTAIDQGLEGAYTFLGLGLTQAALGEREEARANLERGLALFEDDPSKDCPDPQLGDLIAQANSTLETLPS